MSCCHHKTQFQVGDKVKIIANSNNHTHKIDDTEHKVTMILAGTTQCRLDNNNGLNIMFSDIQLLPITKERLEKKKKCLARRLEKVEFQLKFMEDFKLEEFDPMQMQVVEVLNVLDKTDSKLKRAKKIVEIING